MECLDRIKKSACLPLSAVSMILMCSPAFAADVSSAVTPADWSSIISAMTGQISVSTVVGVVASAISAGIGLVFLWWGGRKAVRTLMAAFRNGKVSM